MKKIITLIIFLIIILGGKWFIDNKTVDYEEMVSKSFSSYYINGSTNELKSVVDLFNKISYDETLRKDIQNYNFNIVQSWYSYLDGKYVCTKANLNSCLVQVEEFKVLEVRIKDLYNYKCKDGFTLILPSSYTKIINDVEEKIVALNKIINSPSAKNPKNSEEIRNDKCNNAINCDSCREGLCVCTYVTENKKSESLTCKDKNYKPEQH